MRRLLCLLALAWVLAGCATSTPTRGSGPGGLPEPPPVRVVVAGEEVGTYQGSYCWSEPDGTGACVDSVGPTRRDLVDAGPVDAVEIVLGTTVDSLRVELSPVEARGCWPAYVARVEDLGDDHYLIHPVGPAGERQVSVVGRTEQGEVPGYFRWQMPTGAAPSPTGRLGIVWEDDGELQGQGFSLQVDDLPVGAEDASATITATASNGATLTFDAGDSSGCRRSDHLSFGERGTTVSDRVAALGPAPFEYVVDLTLDGQEFQGTGTWPEPVDSDPGDDNPAPVQLAWEPSLSTYAP